VPSRSNIICAAASAARAGEQAEAPGKLLEHRQEIGGLFPDGLNPSPGCRRGDSDRRNDSRRDPEQRREWRELRNGGDQQADDDFHVGLLAGVAAHAGPWG
jgi:hypothetical protein